MLNLTRNIVKHRSCESYVTNNQYQSGKQLRKYRGGHALYYFLFAAILHENNKNYRNVDSLAYVTYLGAFQGNSIPQLRKRHLSYGIHLFLLFYNFLLILFSNHPSSYGNSKILITARAWTTTGNTELWYYDFFWLQQTCWQSGKLDNDLIKHDVCQRFKFCSIICTLFFLIESYLMCN